MRYTVVYQNNEALRCAQEQEEAKIQLGDMRRLTSNLIENLHETWSRYAYDIIDDIDHTIRERRRAIRMMQWMCAEQASLCRHADTAYLDTDQQAADNLNQQL